MSANTDLLKTRKVEDYPVAPTATNVVDAKLMNALIGEVIATEASLSNIIGKNTSIRVAVVDETTGANGHLIAFRGVERRNVVLYTITGIGANSTTDYIGVSVYPRWISGSNRVEFWCTKKGNAMTNTRVIINAVLIEFDT